ncbi:hypothetical protein H6G76_36200 [Nostoc sp. FACHB-152]|uniref:hypothetical protein n=1 Tax=unclassified Nostoc TaxID=2593658 RepID=UPI00168568A0|nr:MULTISPECIES: hypothetical protein [unclassified Nostoc]MBD2452446.1 hypothetical protein [Nostoc sp. FACHB-152]MBD2473311.1 hypothetical protein [Nostoc sp. FACHB-145]
MPQITTTEQLTSVEIDFYNHEIYCGQKLIARITYDHNDLTQPWVVEVNNQEVFRRSWYQKCFDDISWHYSRGFVPVQQEETPAATTGNEIMCEVARYCEIFGLEISDDDSIYRDGQQLGQVGCTNGQLWYIRASSNHRQNVASARNAVVALSGVQPRFFEDLMDKPFDLITRKEWLILGEYELVQDLVAA